MSSHLGYKIFSGGCLFVIAVNVISINKILLGNINITEQQLVEINKNNNDKQKVQPQIQAPPYILNSWYPWPGVATKSRSSQELK
jgi:hypothetical protein